MSIKIVDLIEMQGEKMKLSTKGRYGLRLMIDIARHGGSEPVILADIAQREEMSVKYLWHLINPLKTAGLIRSVRGAHGGYYIAKPLNDITLKDIVCALEGSMSVTECVDMPAICDRSDGCISREIWKDISDKISGTLESITLQNIVEKKNNKKGKQFDYVI